MHNHGCTRSRFPLIAGLFLLALSTTLTGCGPSLAQVTGKVTYKGKPVKGGTIVFSPQGAGADDTNPGKSATADVQDDGTFTLKTNGPNDGAQIGKHKVSYNAPQVELTEAQKKTGTYNPPPSEYAGLVPKSVDVEVKAGANTIDIELTPGTLGDVQGAPKP